MPAAASKHTGLTGPAVDDANDQKRCTADLTVRSLRTLHCSENAIKPSLSKYFFQHLRTMSDSYSELDDFSRSRV